MRFVSVCLLLGAGLIVLPPAGAEPTTDQFAFGLPLQVSGEHPFYELELPLPVYQGCARSDLGDLRVFNAAGQVVPHARRGPANQTRQQDLVTTELPFFPIPGEPGQHDDNLAVHVRRTPEGSVIDLRVDRRQGSPRGGAPASYLLDASALRQRIDALELLWSEDTAAFLAEATIETSNDLAGWRPLTSAAVARLDHQKHRLDQNRIPLPQAHGRYLRLRWAAGPPAATLARVRAITRQSLFVERPAARRLVLTPERLTDRRYRADLQGALPVSAITVSLPGKNTLAAVRLHSSAQAKGPMQERWRGLAYQLTANGSQLASPAIALTPSRQRFWELTVEESEAVPGAAPQLEFAWQPDRLVFLAQGDGPYLVAYGSAAVGPTDFPIESLLKGSAVAPGSWQPQLVQPGEPVALGGRQPASARLPLPWKEYGLWGVLSLGVLLIGGMSFSLYRKLRDSDLS